MFYDRKIKYLEYRVNGERISGVGFVKLEARDTMCSIQLNISGLFKVAGIKDAQASVLLKSGSREVEFTTIVLAPDRISYEFANMQMENMKGTGIAYPDLDAIRIEIAPGREIYCAIREIVSRMPEKSSGSESEYEIPNERDGQSPEYNYEMPEETKEPEYSFGTLEKPEESGYSYGMPEKPEESGYSYGMPEKPEESGYSYGMLEKPEEPEYNYGMSGEAEYGNGVSDGGEPTLEYNYEMPDEGDTEPEYGYGVENERGGRKLDFDSSNEVSVQEQSKQVWEENAVPENDKAYIPNRKNKRKNHRREAAQMSDMYQKEGRLQENKWHQLSAIYPHINPFQDEREYLSISPNDFVVLSEKFYKLIHNSFLLHGYYNYRHLILQRLEQRGEVKYYIGVPGNFYDREKQVAVMFGFESFECMDEPARSGDYGYYMMRVEI